MIESHFSDFEGSEAVRFSDSDFDLVVQALDDAAGKLFPGAEIVEDEGSVGAEHLDDLLQGFDAGAHRLIAPLVEKLAGPGGRDVLPELVEVLFKNVGSDALQVVAQQVPGYLMSDVQRGSVRQLGGW